MINLLLFFEENNLKSHLKSLEGDFQIVTPNPSHADMMRKLFDSEQRFEVHTIANFMKMHFQELFEEDLRDKRKSKSELLLTLGALWRLIDENVNYELFQKSFELLTDFRSFSMNEAVLEEILENYDESLKKNTLWFHRVLNELDIIDEHRSYFLLAEKLRSGDLPILYESEKNIILFGFDFLTPSQVDLVNALAIRNNIYIPFSKGAYDKSSDLDWIKWVAKSDTNTIEIDKDERQSPHVKMYEFSKNSLASTLLAFKQKERSIILGTKQVDLNSLGEIPYSDCHYKVPINLFEKELKEIEKSLYEELESKKLSTEEFLKILLREQQSCIHNENFKGLKFIRLLNDVFTQWKSLSEKNTEVSLFELKLFLEVSSLDLPRNSVMNSGVQERELLSLKELDKVQKNKKYFLCISENYGNIKSSVVDYDEEVQKYLASIGPIRRSEFEFEILKSKLITKLNHGNIDILIQKGLKEENLAWNDTLSNLKLERQEINQQESDKKPFHYFEHKDISYKLESYSATKLQTYIDCPQKFWLKYIQKMRVNLKFDNELTLLEVGRIQHALIEKFVETYSCYDEESHLGMINDLIDMESKQNLDEHKKFDYQNELFLSTKVIINDLITLKQKGFKFSFEKSIGSSFTSAEGSIDLLAESKDMTVLVDFKRGSGSIPSKKAFLDYEKIQIWFYLNYLKKVEPDFDIKPLVVGYINLSEPSKSLLIANSEEAVSVLAKLEGKSFAKVYNSSKEFPETFASYMNFESDLIEKIKADKEFKALPAKDNICDFCDMNRVCSR